ncbi:S-layer homology domain-containing protein [Paenibacillus xylanilyticus]|uniref:S-layer homology domain-containing protein n=1 Tax=Paenibacillus xylanilyticus TaxID=248903 RepID=A0A7Y6BVV5_9BACL|nr:S-layer homology domain-containing protein [Paenibacillus xylanilyticus]NUU75756.1 S-layer homology domain-containing protein [Paenibacillus xylanilyticus]
MKHIKKIVTAALFMSLALGVHNASAEASFKDVPPSHWANNAIQSAVSKGYFKGYSDGTFKPNAPVSREEFAVLMARVSSNDQVNSSVELKDVTGRWSETGVTEAVAKGFVNGNTYAVNGFKPQQEITRVEMVRWMVSGLQVKDGDYSIAVSDTMNTIVPVAEFYKGGLSEKDYGVISVALGTGLMNGYSDGKFNPNKTTTRAEVAAILLRYEQVQDKQPEDYGQLKEMREIGLTGSNMYTMGIKARKQTYGTVMDFANTRGKIHDFVRKNGTFTLENLIVVDPLKKESLYYKMFVTEEDNRTKVGQNKDDFLLFTLFKATPKVAIKNWAEQWTYTQNFYTWTYMYQTKGQDLYGYPHLPMSTEKFSELIPANIETSYWGYYFIEKSGGFRVGFGGANGLDLYTE